MPYGTTMSFFQKGIRPEWEDPALVEGARFSIKSDKSHTSKYWEDLLLAMIGEQMEDGLVAGLVLNLKPQFDKIAIWVIDSRNEAKIEQLKKDIINTVGLDEKDLEYEVFKNISTAKNDDKFKNNKNKNFKQFGNTKNQWNKSKEGQPVNKDGFKRAEKSVKKEGEEDVPQPEN